MLDVAEKFSLDDLQKKLEKLPTDNSDLIIRDNLSLIHEISKPERITSTLKEILHNPDILHFIANRSYRHVNHFDKIVLVDSENQLGYRLTLHLWNPPYTEKELNDELIHDHRFNFWSNILTGDLISENFQRSTTGNSFRKFQYTPEKKTLSNFYTFSGEERLSKAETSRKITGESYYLSYQSIHRVLLPQTSMTCTLVLRGPRQRNHSNVFNTTYPRENQQIVQPMFSSDALATKLGALIKAIENRPDYLGRGSY